MKPAYQIGLLVIVVLGGLLWGTNYWVTHKIRSVLDQQVDKGNLQYESVNLNIFTNHINLTGVRWESKKMDVVTNTYSAQQIQASGFNFIQYLAGDKIIFENVTISAPEVILRKHPRDTLSENNPKSQTAPPHIASKVLEINDGKLDLYEMDSDSTAFSVQAPFIRLNEIQMDSTTVHQPIPFDYASYDLSVHSLFYRMSSLFHLTIRNIEAGNSGMVLDTLEIQSPYSKSEFSSQIPFEKAWIDLVIPKIELSNIELGSTRDTFEIAAQSVRIRDADLDIYKDNRLPDYPYFKPLYSRLIREMPIKLSIDSTHVIGADIQFQVQTREEPPPGMIYFENINGIITNLRNVGLEKPDFHPITVYAKTQFMGSSQFELNWSLNPGSPEDALIVSGVLSRIEGQKINHIVTPALNIEIDGAISKLAFNFAGNNESATGDMYVDYDALRIHVLKEDGTARQQWTSSILNFLLKNNLDGTVEEKGLRVERVQTKSFWHYLWSMVRKGTLESIL